MFGSGSEELAAAKRAFIDQSRRNSNDRVRTGRAPGILSGAPSPAPQRHYADAPLVTPWEERIHRAYGHLTADRWAWPSNREAQPFYPPVETEREYLRRQIRAEIEREELQKLAEERRQDELLSRKRHRRAAERLRSQNASLEHHREEQAQVRALQEQIAEELRRIRLERRMLNDEKRSVDTFQTLRGKELWQREGEWLKSEIQKHGISSDPRAGDEVRSPRKKSSEEVSKKGTRHIRGDSDDSIIVEEEEEESSSPPVHRKPPKSPSTTLSTTARTTPIVLVERGCSPVTVVELPKQSVNPSVAPQRLVSTPPPATNTNVSCAGCHHCAPQHLHPSPCCYHWAAPPSHPHYPPPTVGSCPHCQLATGSNSVPMMNVNPHSPHSAVHPHCPTCHYHNTIPPAALPVFTNPASGAPSGFGFGAANATAPRSIEEAAFATHLRSLAGSALLGGLFQPLANPIAPSVLAGTSMPPLVGSAQGGSSSFSGASAAAYAQALSEVERLREETMKLWRDSRRLAEDDRDRRLKELEQSQTQRIEMERLLSKERELQLRESNLSLVGNIGTTELLGQPPPQPLQDSALGFNHSTSTVIHQPSSSGAPHPQTSLTALAGSEDHVASSTLLMSPGQPHATAHPSGSVVVNDMAKPLTVSMPMASQRQQQQQPLSAPPFLAQQANETHATSSDPPPIPHSPRSPVSIVLDEIDKFRRNMEERRLRDEEDRRKKMADAQDRLVSMMKQIEVRKQTEIEKQQAELAQVNGLIAKRKELVEKQMFDQFETDQDVVAQRLARELQERERVERDDKAMVDEMKTRMLGKPQPHSDDVKVANVVEKSNENTPTMKWSELASSGAAVDPLQTQPAQLAPTKHPEQDHVKAEQERIILENKRKEEEERLKFAEKQKKEEEERLKAVNEKQKKEEEERLKAVAEKQKKEEEERLKAAERQKKEEEEERLKAAEKQKKEEEDRLKAAAIEKQRIEEEERLKAVAEKQKKEEEERLKAAAEKQKKEEEDRLKAVVEKQKKEEEEAKAEASKVISATEAKPVSSTDIFRSDALTDAEKFLANVSPANCLWCIDVLLQNVETTLKRIKADDSDDDDDENPYLIALSGQKSSVKWIRRKKLLETVLANGKLTNRATESGEKAQTVLDLVRGFPALKDQPSRGLMCVQLSNGLTSNAKMSLDLLKQRCPAALFEGWVLIARHLGAVRAVFTKRYMKIVHDYAEAVCAPLTSGAKETLLPLVEQLLDTLSQIKIQFTPSVMGKPVKGAGGGGAAKPLRVGGFGTFSAGLDVGGEGFGNADAAEQAIARARAANTEEAEAPSEEAQPAEVPAPKPASPQSKGRGVSGGLSRGSGRGRGGVGMSAALRKTEDFGNSDLDGDDDDLALPGLGLQKAVKKVDSDFSD